ncbi:uncharacterized protein PSFLO_04103 [Pseudozyma flocculosa]|nr:uncharacterized protein PSFLO_04103 [Pseudozyma flocculosa]
MHHKASAHAYPTRDDGYEARDFYDDSGYDHRPYDSSATALPLKHHAGQMGYAEDEEDEEHQLKRGPEPLFSNQVHHHRPGLSDEEAKSGLLSRFTAGAGAGGAARTPEDKLHEQIERRRQGIGRQRWPIVSYVMTVALVAVFIVELVKAKSVTGQAVQTHPNISPMLGPSSEFLISFGARFVPCMRDIAKLPVTTELPCLNASASSSGTYTQDQLCPLWQTCGLADANSPNQGYRFISAMFIHAGFVHIIFNLLVLLTLCAQIERLVGSVPYTLIYFAGGVGGNLLGGNFGLIGQPALGASGAIYTCISVELVDLIYNWQYEYRAKTRLAMSLIFTVIGLALGLLPGIDNFSHIGGFCVGILGGLLFAPAIHPTRRHRIVCWLLRLVSLGLLVGFFVGLAVNFYNSADPLTACTWCRYLSCLPVFNSCKGDGLTTSTTTTTTTTSPNNNFFVGN